jgi:hypothetical protein
LGIQAGVTAIPRNSVRVEQRDASAGRKVLREEVEQQRALAGAGLADEVEVAAAFVITERDKIARNASAESDPMFGRMDSRKGTGVPCDRTGKGMRAAPFPKGAPGLHGVARHCAFRRRLPSPPLTAGSFPATILSGWRPQSF